MKMSSPPNITFGYLQMEERYKQLERTIKRMQLNQREKDSAGIQVFDPQSCGSSVNGNTLDNTIGETNSRVGSEVVSSSTNMRNILSQKLNTPTHGVRTSSVKNSPDLIDRVIMPPPKTIGILAHSSRRNSLASPQIIHKTTISGVESNNSLISAINYPTPSDFNKKQRKILHSTLDTNNPDRIFNQWKVGLSSTGELLIKGLIDDNKYVRSKPVVERINATTVKSFFSHIYSLQGRIHDESNELPEYVRGKFYNGFPDDWKNVHRVWQSYVAGGCSDKFRWPTPIADSDDDLISEVTEVYDPSKLLRRSRARKRSLQSHESTKDFSKKSLTESSVKQKLLSPRHSSAQLSEDQSSLIVQAPAHSVQKSLNKSSRSGSRISHRVEKVPKNSGDDSRQKVDDVLGKILLNSGNPQPSNEKLETLQAFSVLLKNKKYSVEFLENIVEISNSLMSVITRTSDENSAEGNQLPTIENVNSSKNHSATYTKADINKNLTASSNKLSRERVLDQESSKYSAKNKLKYVSARRKLADRDYESSEELNSDDDKFYDNQRALNPRSLRVSRKRLYERPERINHSRRRRSFHSENSDSDDFAHKNKKFLVSSAYDDRRKMIHVVDREQNKFSRNEVKNPIQSSHPVRNSRIPPLPPPYLHDRGGAESASTITGFLANYDSYASITEDERTLRNIGRQKIHSERNNGKFIVPVEHKYPVNYDSCISITEDESSKITKVINENNYKKPVLQETNSQYLDQVMKRTSLQRLAQFSDFHQPQQSSKSHLSLETPKEFPPAVSPKITITDDKENEKLDNRQTLLSISPKISQGDDRQEPVNKITSENIKPTIVRVENIALKLNPRQKDSSSRKVTSPKKTINNPAAESKLIKNNPRSSVDKTKVSNPPESLKSDIPDKVKSPDKYPWETRSGKLLEMQSKEVFGSDKNPKVLTCWMPNIKKLSDKKYGLIFEGKLLNEVGHVISKKYVTDLIIRRVNPRLVETVNNEFYQLSGDIVNTSHVVPQQLQKLCLDGCPAKIAAFCEKWANIKNYKDDDWGGSTQSLSGSIDIASAPTSSRGRRIVQTLRYWEGERLSMKGDEVYYSPGHFQESVMSSNETSRKDTTQSSPRKHSSSAKDETVPKKNPINPEKEKKSHYSADQQGFVKTKQMKDNNNYNLNKKKSWAKSPASPRVPENRRRSQRFRTLKRKSYHEVSSMSSDSSDSDDGKLDLKRRRNVANRNEVMLNVNKKKLESKKKPRHDRNSSDLDETPDGISYQYRKVAYDDKFFSDE